MTMSRSAVLSFLLLFSIFTHGHAQQPVPAEGNEQQLIAVLQSDAALFEKAKACQRLAVIGTDECIPALAALLGDKNLSHYARTGLEAIPGKAVDDALRSALETTKGEQLAGVINSLATRGDEQAANAIGKLIASADPAVSSSALSALGRIASKDAVNVLTSALGNQNLDAVVVADACLTAADRMLNDGNNERVVALLEAVRSANLPKHIDVAARFAEVRTGSRDISELIGSYLSADDRDLFRVGLELAHNARDSQTTGQLVSMLETMPRERRILLLHVLGARGDSDAVPAVVDAAGSKNTEIQITALQVLGQIGDASVFPTLLEASKSKDDVLATVAGESLIDLPDDSVDRQIAGRIRSTVGRQRLALINAAGSRGIKEAIPTLMALMTTPNETERTAVTDALGMTIGMDELPALVDRLLRDPSVPLLEALRKACQRASDRDAAADMLFSKMNGASDQAKSELLDLLIYVGGEKALAAIGETARSSDDALADPATRALGKWLTPDVADVLLDLAENGNPKFRVRCLRGYIRVIRQFGLRANARMTMSRKAFTAATRDEERQLVLDTITRFPSGAALKFAVAQLKKPALREAAAASAIAIAESIVDRDRKSVSATIDTILASTKDPDLLGRARVLKDRSR